MLVNVYNSNQAVTYNFHPKILLIKLKSSENSEKPIKATISLRKGGGGNFQDILNHGFS